MEESNKQKAAKTKSPMAEADEEDGVHNNNNNNNISNSQRSREEGELSSYEDDVDFVVQDYRAISSSPQLTGDNAALVEPVHVGPANKSNQDIKAGKSASSNNFVSGIPSKGTLQSNHPKSCEKNKGPFVPFLITFSDDDSGSDSEHIRQRNTVLTKGRNLGADRSKRPPVTSIAKSQKPRETRSEAKMLPRKVSLSRTFVSPGTQTHCSSSLSDGCFPTSRKSNTSKRLANQDHGRKGNFHLNTSKLQDLRQLIAMRENELKRKSAQQTKTLTSSSHRDYNFTNLSDEDRRGRRAISVDNVECEAKEPEKKRPKHDELKSSQHVAAGYREVPIRQSLLVSEMSALVANSNQHKAEEDLTKEVPMHASPSNLAGSLKEDRSRKPVSSTNFLLGVKEGTDIMTKSRQLDGNSKIANTISSSEQHPQTANQTAKNILRKTSIVDLKSPAKLSNQCKSSPFQDNVTSECYFTGRNDQHQIRSNEKALQPTSNNTYQGCLSHLPESNLRTSDGSLNNPSFWNSICIGSSDMDLQALLDLEESHDKELEEAQEYRRKCEVEERNALDAYRRAQRALAEANARCSYLYRRREIYSAQLRSLMMENSNLFWSSRTNDQFESRFNPSNNFSNVNVHLIPSSSGQMQAENDAYNHQTFDPPMHSADDIDQDLHASGQNLASDPASEPDDSTSEPHKGDGVGDGVYRPEDDSTMSGNEDGGTYHVSENGLECERKGDSSGDIEKGINDGSERHDQLDNSQDSLLLEASLRAQLFERLQMNALPKKRGPSLVEPLDEGTGNDDGGGKVEHDSGKMPPSEGQEHKHSDFPGMQQDQYMEKAGAGASDHTGLQPTRVLAMSCPNPRSAFHHLKIAEPSIFVQLQIRSPEKQILYADDKNVDDRLPNENKQMQLSWTSTETTFKDLSVGQIGSYSCSLAIDPFWPLCMYELRGKCNNDECPWQHVRNYSSYDCQVASSHRKFDNTTTLTNSIDCLVLYPPAYLVDLDVLQANLGAYKCFLTRGCGQCWRKCYSASLVLSSLLPIDLHRNEPFLHGSEPHIEAHASWNRQLLDFHGRNGISKQTDQHLADDNQALEIALLNLSSEANKQKGRLEALKVLARSVEAHPTSEVLWIVYLQIYYSNQKSVGKDDMFQCAVEHNENSYELWLLYINSRTRLDERLAAYDAALSALCRHMSVPDGITMHASKCILDIFLQMINCLCMSGNVYRALDKIYGLTSSVERSDDLNQLFFSDIISCLTIYDKCIFWICCIYFIIYRKLPGAILQQFEFQKELNAIEWPDTQLAIEGKQQANSLIGIAVDSLALHINADSLENEETLRAAHLFAINHVRCVAVLEGLECSRNLLEKYIKLYPSCLELVLISAWTEHESESEKFAGFEKAISNWLEDIPGIQCLWNQYAASAIQGGRLDIAKELMDRWFHSVWKVQYSQGETVDNVDDESFSSSPHSHSESHQMAWRSFCSQSDIVFGLLNYSLHKILNNDHAEARSALDKALKAATAENYTHCVREHALFSLASSLPHNKDAHIRDAMKILSGLLVDARASCGSESLSRNYIQKIRKPRVRHLVSKLLRPSSDLSLLNSVLEVWYGPSLLPQAYYKPSDTVDFVESVLGILPSNYQLAISVCKHLTQSSKTAKLPANISFWASSLLVNTLFQAVPLAPESVWFEAADILRNLTHLHTVSETFHNRALAVYPFSIKLWKSYLSLFNDANNVGYVKEVAREKGINLD